MRDAGRGQGRMEMIGRQHGWECENFYGFAPLLSWHVRERGSDRLRVSHDMSVMTKGGNGIHLTIVVGILTILFTRNLAVEFHTALFQQLTFYKLKS